MLFGIFAHRRRQGEETDNASCARKNSTLDFGSGLIKMLAASHLGSFGQGTPHTFPAFPYAEGTLAEENKILKCWYCGCELKEWKEEHLKGDIRRCRVSEHQTPRSRGGLSVVLACFTCNGRKGTKTVEEYRIYLRERFSTRRAVKALMECLPFLPSEFQEQIQTIITVLEFFTPKIIFFGESQATEFSTLSTGVSTGGME